MPTNPQDALSTINFPLPPGDNPASFLDFYDAEEAADPSVQVFDFSDISSFYSGAATDGDAFTADAEPGSNTLPDTDPDYIPIYSNNQLSGYWYNKYEIATSYLKDLGTRQQAICGPAGTPPEEVRVHGGRQIKIIAWIAERYGTWPVLPSWQTGIPGDTLAFQRITPEAPQPNTDGYSLCYRVTGVYIYHCAYILSDSDPLNAGTTDIIATPATSNNVSYGTFGQNLLQGLAPAGPLGSIAS